MVTKRGKNLKIEIDENDGLIELCVGSKSCKIDPFDLEERLIEIRNFSQNGQQRPGREMVRDFNSYLQTVGLPPIGSFGSMLTIWSRIEEAIGEMAKKGQWVGSTSTTPTSSGSTELTSSTYPPADELFSDLPPPPSEPVNALVSPGPG